MPHRFTVNASSPQPTSAREFRPVSARSPCPACGKSDWCAWTESGMLKCERTNSPPAGMKLVSKKDGGGVFANIRADRPCHKSRTVAPDRNSGRSADLLGLNSAFQARITPEQISTLATTLGVTPGALGLIGIGWATRSELGQLGAGGKEWDRKVEGAYAFPECDSNRSVVGFAFRTLDNKHGAPSSYSGARRGLVVPDSLTPGPQTPVVMVVEGASDVAACLSLGVIAVGRPSNASGVDDLTGLLEGAKVIVLGENDQKDDGLWPGRDGARKVAAALSERWQRDVSWALPPTGIKDVRDYLCKERPDLSSASTCESTGRRFVDALDLENARYTPRSQPSPHQTTASIMVNRALQDHRVGRLESGEAFLAPLSGRNIAIMLDDDKAKQHLARAFRRDTGRVAGSSEIADALNALRAEALDQNPEPLGLRLRGEADRIVVDLGTADGRVVVIDRDGWKVVDRSPVSFRRTPLTGPQVTPERGGDLQHLRSLLNVSDQQWPLLLAWLVAAYVEQIAHPILLLGAEQGAGKSTAARMLLRLIDPSPAAQRSVPKSPQDWAVSSAGSWAFVVDNVSVIPDWWSDALCKIVTGDAWVSRALFTNTGVSVLAFRRVVALTSIDPGVLRGDLADRLLMLDLAPISETQRKTELQLEEQFQRMRAGVLGALFDFIAQVLAILSTVELTTSPRMADFAQVLAAVDRLLSTDGLNEYLSQRNRMSREVLEDDGVGQAMLARFGFPEDWCGTAADLLNQLVVHGERREWPWSPSAFGRRLRRLGPALRTVGIEIEFPRRTDKRRVYTVRVGEANALNAHVPETGPHPAEIASYPMDFHSGRRGA